MCKLPQLIERGNVGSKKPQTRSLSIVIPIVNKIGVIRLTVGRDATTYAVQVFGVPAEMGSKAIQWQAMEQPERTHHGLIENNGRISCDCMGHLRWGKCKHADATKKLVELGSL